MKKDETVWTFLLCSVIALICCFSKAAKAGALEGIRLCEEVIIPSLLPLLIICTLIVNSRCAIVIEKLFGRIFEKLFGLPRCTAAAVIFGLIGGYPTGTVLTYRLFDMGLIDGKTAERLMRFNFCGGFAFLITAVGTVTYGSTKTGLIIFFSNAASALIIMLFGSLGRKQNAQTCAEFNYPKITEALPDSVEASVKALLTMSAYIVLFSSVRGIINIPSFLMPVIEITSGVCGKERLPLPYCSFFTAFGGLCIHLQLYGFLNKMKVKYVEFLIYRTAGALLSFIITKLCLFAFPQSAEVFSNISSPVHEFSSGGVALSMIMIMGCAVIVFDIENRKLI